MHTRPVWVEISRSNLLANYRALRELANQFHRLELLAVVKANAYGHGILECAPLLAGAGAQWFGVTCVEEGLRLRVVCPDSRILIMSGIYPGEAEAIIEHNLTPVVWESFHFDLLEAAMKHHPPKRLPVHLEIDTGMSRQGVRELAPILPRFQKGSPLWMEGLMTHFSDPEVLDSTGTRDQIALFESAYIHVAGAGLRPRLIHAGNSATLLLERDLPNLQQIAGKAAATLMLRPGLALYGYAPRFSASGRPLAPPNLPELQPVLSWKSRIASLRTIRPGDSAGYNSTFRATRPTRLALLPLGYADGLNRLLSNRGEVLIRNQRAPVAGRISMDQTIIDVTDIPEAAIGDEAVLIGIQGTESITACDIANLTQTIPYEILCNINTRVTRILTD